MPPTFNQIVTNHGLDIMSDGFGGSWKRGINTAVVTFSSSGTAFDSATDLLPANAVIASVTAVVSTTIATATAWNVGDPTVSDRFIIASSSELTAGIQKVGLKHIDVAGSSGPRQTAAAKIRISTTGTPTAGAVRVAVHYNQFIAPTT